MRGKLIKGLTRENYIKLQKEGSLPEQGRDYMNVPKMRCGLDVIRDVSARFLLQRQFLEMPM